MKESEIEESILQYLEILKVKAIKIPNAGFFDGNVMRKHRSKYVLNGISDVFVWTHGRFIALEIKSPKELVYINKHYDKIKNTNRELLNKKQKHIQDQILFLDMIKSQGFEGHFVSSIEEVKNIIKNFTQMV